MALEQYTYWDPDTVLVEAKASGLPLTHELPHIGIPDANFTPSRVTTSYPASTVFRPCLRLEWFGPPMRLGLMS